MATAPWRLRHVVFPVCTLALLLCGHVLGQQPAAKRSLRHSDYDAWRSIQGQRLSPDGKFLAYALTPQEGDGEVVVRRLATGVDLRFPRGSRPWFPTILPKSSLTKAAQAEPPSRLAFTADSRFLVFQITPSVAELDKLKKSGKLDETARNSLGIVDLASGKMLRVARVKAFQVPEDAGRFLVYHRDTLPDPTKVLKKPEASGTKGGKKKGKAKEVGTDLVLRDLRDHSEGVFPDVLEFTLSKDGRTLVYVTAKKADANLYAATPGSAAPPLALLSGPGRYAKLTWDEKQTQFAFLGDREKAGGGGPHWRLYRWDRRAAIADAAQDTKEPRPLRAAHVIELVTPTTSALRPGTMLSEHAALSFSPDGSKLFLGVAPVPDKPPAKSAAKEDKVAVELWHWKGDFVPPMEKIRAAKEGQRTYRALYHLKEGKFVQLADATMADVAVGEGAWGIGHDDRPYRTLVGFDAIYADHFLVDLATGNRQPLLRKHEGAVTLSPGGKHALFHDGKDWHAVALPSGKTINLSAKLGVAFAQEDFDTPGTPPSYGVAGWTPDDRHVLLYDRYDVWQVAADGSGALNLTGGIGRKGLLQFRHVRLDPRAKTVDLTKPLLLRAENLDTRATGFYRLRPGSSPPERLVMAAKNFGPPQKAKNADVLALTVSTFHDFPDLYVTTTDFKGLTRVSDANPQKAGLLWGSAELIRYKSVDGTPLQGMLIKPENFDPRKKYPLLVYIYERLSQNLHHFVDPRPGTSINLSYYASNGYLVLLPDIAYKVGYPGQSALKCVLPAVQTVVDRGCVDEKAIGIQGHSWGGYQIAYMVTQTDRFKAAAAGAPVANMTSAYGGIRWGSGLPRQFQYERTQSRIGGSLWQYPLRFIENSPLFMADRVRTPVLMLHNDADDAVPWYQGIEFFLALRRLGKEVYLFNYHGELHGLRKRSNQKDYTVRLQQFFDHLLRGAPQPAWMESGIPYRPRPASKQ